MTEIKRKRAAGEKGKLVVKVSREQLMTWAELFIDKFNLNEKTGISNVIVPCLTKFGQNIFTKESKPFEDWLDSLNANALYKAFLMRTQRRFCSLF